MNALNIVARELGIYPSWLNALITFESGGKPGARNPYSGARGLIQFTNTTAKELGYKDADDLYDKNPTDTSQLLGPVLKYLKKYAPFPTEQSLYMAVFYPAARAWPLEQQFPDTVKQLNPGIVTVNDYVNKVRHAPIIKAGVTLAGIVLLLGASYFGYQYVVKPIIQKEAAKWTAQKGPQIKVTKPEAMDDSPSD